MRRYDLFPIVLCAALGWWIGGLAYDRRWQTAALLVVLMLFVASHHVWWDWIKTRIRR